MLVPLMLGVAGYRSNGDCLCGCSVDCPAPYLRWVCPADIGYACSSAQDDSNPPLFGDPDRVVPCTSQPAAVHAVLNLFWFFVPAVFALAAAACAYYAPIDATLQREILEQCDNRKKGAPAIDPLTKETIPRHPSESEAAILKALRHFSEGELEKLSNPLWAELPGGLAGADDRGGLHAEVCVPLWRRGDEHRLGLDRRARDADRVGGAAAAQPAGPPQAALRPRGGPLLGVAPSRGAHDQEAAARHVRQRRLDRRALEGADGQAAARGGGRGPQLRLVQRDGQDARAAQVVGAQAHALAAPRRRQHLRRQARQGARTLAARDGDRQDGRAGGGH
eukprot:4884761-Prymnesium_polylepis.3